MIGVVGEGLDPPVGKSDLDGRIFRIFTHSVLFLQLL